MTVKPIAPFVPPSKWRLRRWWGRFPRWSRAAALLLAVAVLAVGGYYWFGVREKAVARQQVADGWAAFEKAARSLDDAGMMQALDDLAALQPDDDQIARRRRALAEGDADPTDRSMCAVTVLRHVRASRWPEAEREADKRLVHDADDWVCRCAKVAAAFARNDRAAASKLLDQLPDPAARGANINSNGVLFAAQLYRAADRDPAPLRTFLRGVIVDRLRTLAADTDPPAVTVLLLKCYLEAFHPTDANPPSLALAVADIGRLIGSATATAAAANDTPTLLQLGQTCERLFWVWDVLRRDEAMTADQHKAVIKDHHERTRALWQAVRDRAAGEPQAYRGLALAFLRDGDIGKAAESVSAGLVVSGNDPQLIAFRARLLQIDNRGDAAFAAVAESADRDPTNVPLQLIAAEAAAAIDRNDLVVRACERVYKQAPKNPIAARLEARARLRAGDAHKAMQVLSERIGEDRLCEDATAARWYVRSRLEAAAVGLDVFVKKCEDAAAARQNPLLIAAALAGILDAKFDAEWSATAERTAARWLERWPDNVELLRVRAGLLARLAERVAPPWTETRVRPAVSAYTELKRKVPDDADLATALAWLRLKGERDVPRAVADAAVLIAADTRREPLTPRHLEVLGAVYLADGKLDPAVRVLELAVRYGPTPTGRVHLALAYLKRGRAADTRATLDAARAARTSPWTEQEDADYRATVQALQQENR